MTDPLDIAATFRLEGKPVSARSYGGGHIHDTYLVRTDQSHAYILQKVNTQVFKKPEAIQDNIIRIMDHLRQSDDIPQDKVRIRMDMQYDSGGNSLVKDDDAGLWRSFSYIGNTYTLERVSKPEEAFSGASAFGTFIRMLEKYNPRRLHITIPNFLDIEWRLANLEYAWKKSGRRKQDDQKKAANRKKLAQPSYRTIARQKKIASQFTKIRQALPERVIHNDAKISNILFERPDGKRSYLIDLDTVMPGTMLTDFGDMVRTFTVRGTEDTIELDLNRCDESLYDGLVAGFADAVGSMIKPVEQSNLLLGAKLMVYMQAIRFLTDYLEDDVYYKTEYEDHNLVRTRNQLDLLASLIDQEKRLKEIIQKHFK